MVLLHNNQMKILLAEIRHLDTQAGVMGGDKAIK